jgi:hypothetical protein
VPSDFALRHVHRLLVASANGSDGYLELAEETCRGGALLRCLLFAQAQLVGDPPVGLRTRGPRGTADPSRSYNLQAAPELSEMGRESQMSVWNGLRPWPGSRAREYGTLSPLRASLLASEAVPDDAIGGDRDAQRLVTWPLATGWARYAVLAEAEFAEVCNHADRHSGCASNAAWQCSALM